MQEIKIENRELLNELTKEIPLSFYRFTNLYMWRHSMNYRMTEIGDAICIFGHYHDHKEHMMYPLGTSHVKEVIDTVLSESKELTVRPLTESMAEELTKLYPNAVLEEKRSLEDYVYLSSDLAELKGKKFHQKRNHFNSFSSKYEYEYVRISSSNFDLLKNAVEKLYTDSGDVGLAEEKSAIDDIIQNFIELQLKAAVITVGGDPVAYSIGETVSDQEAVIHIEKANREFSGSYATINKLFVQNEFSNCKFINREEDMGHPGLRQAKMSYNPDHLNKVYSITIKK